MRDIAYIIFALTICFGPFFAVYAIEEYLYRKTNHP